MPGHVLRPADERHRAVDGATFHTLRHTAASLLREPEAIRKEAMGHRSIATTQRYTHLRPVHEIPTHERLAGAVPIADLVAVACEREACWETCWDSDRATRINSLLGQGQRSSTHTSD